VYYTIVSKQYDYLSSKMCDKLATGGK
jgi:hypothetical protein